MDYLRSFTAWAVNAVKVGWLVGSESVVTEVVEKLRLNSGERSTIVDRLPTHESQARPLARDDDVSTMVDNLPTTDGGDEISPIGEVLPTNEAQVADESPIGDVLPTNEAQARPLAKLKDPNEQLDAWTGVSSPSGEPLRDTSQDYRAGSWIVW